MSREHHITVPKGFVAAGVACGVKPSGRPDVAILAGQTDCAAALVTTRNQIVGAPVQWIRKILPRGCGMVRGIVINAGNSNVCTGSQGLRDAEAMAALAAKLLGADVSAEKMLVASTGVIGRPLPMAKIRKGIAAAGKALGRRGDEAVMQAIMTTDTRSKTAVVQTNIGGVKTTVAGIVKGAGMIAPSMATMIAVLTTDAKIPPPLLRKALRQAVGETFNAITIDSDTSTSDTVAVFASGAAGGKAITAASPAYRKFATTLREVCGELARAVVADGEGATKVIEVAVRGARNNTEAEFAAKSVANSPLVKTAVHGGDPNWGRIAMALGKCPPKAAKVDPAKLKIAIGGITIFARGTGRPCDLKQVEKKMQAETVRIDCDLGLGKGSYTALTCDLSREYIAINADYTT